MKIRIEHLTKRFGNFTAVNDFSTTFEDGELIALLGPSGCGKSTMLNMLSGILPVTEGKIFFDDDEVTDVSPDKRGVGLVFQNYALYPHMTVLQNICFPLEIQKIPKKERIEKAMEMAKLVHVEEFLDRKPGQLSGGQQQRVAIARALVKKPRLLLLDEPLSNLDARLRLEMREEIRRIQQETGITTVFVTHDQEEAMSISDHIVLMKLGVKQQYAKPQDLYNDPANNFVADFLGNPPINKLFGIAKGGNFELEDGSASFPFELCSKVAEGTKVTLGIRAESAYPVNDQNACVFVGEIVSTYAMGKEELGYIKIGSQELRAYIASELGFKKGDSINVGFKDRGIFLFNTETGERIR